MRGKANPTTHISSLARLHVDYCIQMVRPWLLLYSLDASTDLRHDLGDTMQADFMDLLARKYENCTEWYFTNLMDLGIQEPIVVIVRTDGTWQMDEGHHRLAWSLWNNVEEIPVIFDDSGADDDSNMGYLVSRDNVEAYHHTSPADAHLIVDPYRALEPSTIRETVFEPTNRREGKKRGGRHRAPEQGFLSRV